MQLLMITQKLDPKDPILAFTIAWVNALAKRVDHLHVMCLEDKSKYLPKNVTVYSLGKDKGASRVSELITFYKVMFKLSPKIDAVFAHMVPRYAYLAAPVASLYRKPTLLWYTHRQDSRELRQAERVSKFVLTAVPESFPFETPKLRAIGHGIDTNFWQPNTNIDLDSPPTIVQVARLMPIKNQSTLIRAIAQLHEEGYDVRAALIGIVPPGQDAGYGSQLRALAVKLGVGNRIIFTGGKTPEQVRDALRRATVAVNLSPPGLFDKAALESMMVGTPTIVSNAAFDILLRDQTPRFRIDSPTDVRGLVDALKHLLSLSLLERTKMILDINARATTAHSLDGLMDRIVHLSQRGGS